MHFEKIVTWVVESLMMAAGVVAGILITLIVGL